MTTADPARQPPTDARDQPLTERPADLPERPDATVPLPMAMAMVSAGHWASAPALTLQSTPGNDPASVHEPLSRGATALLPEQLPQRRPEQGTRCEGPQPHLPAAVIAEVREQLSSALAGLRADVASANQLAAAALAHADALALTNAELTGALSGNRLDTILRGLLRLTDTLDLVGANEAADVPLIADLSSQVLRLLEDTGLRPVHPAAGDTFNPAQHNGVGITPPCADSPAGTVALTRRCGWQHGDGRLLRPADVIVARAAKAPATGR